ncbi:D-alanyl-D-alanine carboxypeptidase family protein [Microvirga massiliensis]|uniref:D-alanyl-D-alanine carboxypeptidase family protein n=1 Tax=Microvirga massiliensis TaxID=1033741 RepID=UPI00062B9B35|nr:D-alanyl-D-alanine carboxypeptidase family protein [Microvirga massiliensis]
MALRYAFRVAAFAVAVLVSGTAYANGPALVVDVDSGRVLHAERATEPWFPASITKLMTTYVALDMVRDGRASMDQLLSVSEDAARLPPSKMAFKPGSQIRLDNALKIIMVKSANDVAATIAENLGGSAEAFAGMMNDAAAKLGMRESHFVNPHGLPDDRQQTSARDMAILARALIREFPEYGGLFEIGAIQYGRRIMRNHNGLIGRYPGANGMKTGFICAAGFNVVATAERDGKRLITVVLGAPSANERTMRAANLFDRGFGASAGILNPMVDLLPASATTEPPNMRSVICDRRGPVPDEDDSQSQTMAGTVPSGPLASGLLAFAGMPQLAPGAPTILEPRGPVQPIRVWLGLNPPSQTELAKQAEEEEASEKASKATKAASSKKGKKSSSTKVVDKDDGRASISVKPVSGSKKEAASAKSSDKKAAAEAKESAPSNAKSKGKAAAGKPLQLNGGKSAAKAESKQTSKAQ